MNSELVGLYKRRDADMLTLDEEIVFRKKTGEKTELESKLRDLQNRQTNQKQIRDNRAVVMKSAFSELK